MMILVLLDIVLVAYEVNTQTLKPLSYEIPAIFGKNNLTVWLIWFRTTTTRWVTLTRTRFSFWILNRCLWCCHWFCFSINYNLRVSSIFISIWINGRLSFWFRVSFPQFKSRFYTWLSQFLGHCSWFSYITLNYDIINSLIDYYWPCPPIITSHYYWGGSAPLLDYWGARAPPAPLFLHLCMYMSVYMQQNNQLHELTDKKWQKVRTNVSMCTTDCLNCVHYIHCIHMYTHITRKPLLSANMSH